MEGGKDKINNGWFSHNLIPVAKDPNRSKIMQLMLRFSLCSHNLQSRPLQLGSQNILQTARVSQTTLSMFFLPVNARKPDSLSIHLSIHKENKGPDPVSYTDPYTLPTASHLFIHLIGLQLARGVRMTWLNVCGHWSLNGNCVSTVTYSGL